MNRQDIEQYESPAVLKHLDILQEIISRMSSKNYSCKTWTITIVSGLLVLSIIRGGAPIWICLIPLGMFFLLNAYYQGLSKYFIGLQKTFVGKLHNGELQPEDLYHITMDHSMEIYLKTVWEGMKSLSSTLVYFVLGITIIILWIC